MASGVRSDFRRLKIKDESSKRDSGKVDYYPMRMLLDHKTEMYVKFAKVIIIFQGPVTDKRRKAVEDLTSKFKYAGRLVSDETYKKESLCELSERKVEDFYRYFRSRVKKSLEEGYNLITIDQSMTNLHQLKYFYFLAQKMQYVILPFPPLVDYGDVDVRPTQAQKFTKFSERRVDQPNYFNHLFFGWFLHDIDSSELRGESCLYLQDCFDNIPDFRDMFSTLCMCKDFKSFYNMVDQRQDLAFCAVKIIHSLMDANMYMSDDAFKKFYGSMSKLCIVGFIISPDMVAARVKLTYEQKKVWAMPDFLDDGKFQVKFYPTELLRETKIDIPDESVTLIASKSNRTIVSGEPIHEPTEAIHPKAKGLSCHILLGKADTAPKLNVDYDVPFAVFRERNAMQSHSSEVRPYDLDRCLVRRIGKYWFIYLKETLIVNGFFTSCCSLESRV